VHVKATPSQTSDKSIPGTQIDTPTPVRTREMEKVNSQTSENMWDDVSDLNGIDLDNLIAK